MAAVTKSLRLRPIRFNWLVREREGGREQVLEQVAYRVPEWGRPEVQRRQAVADWGFNSTLIGQSSPKAGLGQVNWPYWHS